MQIGMQILMSRRVSTRQAFPVRCRPFRSCSS